MIEIVGCGFIIGSAGVILIGHDPSIPALSGGETELECQLILEFS